MPDFHLSAAQAVNILFSGAVVYAAVITLTRVGGLRSFSKMSSFDFAMTVAIGSLIASSLLTRDPLLMPALVALAVVYLLQIVTGKLRARFTAIERLVDNEPLLLMDGATIMDDNLRRAGVTRDDLRAKLREANVLRLEQVRAVIMETTGDVSVLHAADRDEQLDDELLLRVRR